jgi:PTS system nitrogen regulatory IIA component
LPDPKLALQAVLDRESWGSTEIAPGLALPHARIQGIKHIVAAIGICPAKVFILFLGPADQTQENLSFLAAASAVFQTPGLLENLLTLKTPESVLSKIREAEELL